MALPPELSVLCQILTDSKLSSLDLVESLPHLKSCVSVCRSSLSSSHQGKTGPQKGAGGHVQQFKTALTATLTSRDDRKRYVGVVLVRAVIEVGGIECLHSAEPWVRGLLSLVQVRPKLLYALRVLWMLMAFVEK